MPAQCPNISYRLLHKYREEWVISEFSGLFMQHPVRMGYMMMWQLLTKLSPSCLQVVSMSRCRMTGTMSTTDPGPDNQIARHGLMLASDDKICKFFAPVSPRPAPRHAALRCGPTRHPPRVHQWTAFPFFVRLLLPILVSNWYYECGVYI